MKVNGDLVIVEGGVVKNLTLPSDSTFPSNGSRGELFSVHGHADSTTYPDGLYHHNGTAWDNIASLDQVKALIASGGATPRFRPHMRLSTIVTSQGIGTYWALPNLTVVAIASALGTTPLNMVYLDPADFPSGTKLRISATYSQNNTATAAIDFTIGLRKVGKPATSGGTGTSMLYQADASDVASVTQAGGIAGKAMGRIVSSEFDVPAAGFYTFVVTLSNSNGSSATHWDLVLQSKY